MDIPSSSIGVEMRRPPFTLLMLLSLFVGGLLVSPPATAIINGTFDGTGHPSVGGLVSPTQYSDGTWIYCSGTLISPTVFLTAAHCATDGEPVAVTFDADYEEGDTLYHGTFQADPLYPGSSTTAMTSPSSSSTRPSGGSPPRSCPRPAPSRTSPGTSGSPRWATAPTR